MYLPNPPDEQDVTQDKRGLTGSNLEFSFFYAGCHTKAEELKDFARELTEKKNYGI